MKVLGICLIMLLAALNCLSQRKPVFSDYPAHKVFKGKPARVDLSSAPGSRYFRTRLREAAAAGSNFAGYYAIGLWGCGSPCIRAGMIDLRTGKVTWPPNPEMLVFDIAFRVDSRLVVINSREVLEKARPTGPPIWVGDEWPPELFFVWNGRRFVDVTP
ncbi:hypothetical protein BH18ACI3_BH18ACI3_17540 [soil metagenome]